ncbi:MAG: S26 family signal peptidase [Proteobacteria bacterium]|nr:S26 family signal peptidase [Pseudomonadota bacterium]
MSIKELAKKVWDVVFKVTNKPIVFWGVIGISLPVVLFHYFFTIGVNGSYSLPFKFYLIDKTHIGTIHKGDYVVFKYKGDSFYPKDTWFVKQVVGEFGDVVTVKGRAFFVNDVPVGIAKEKSLKGDPLNIGKTGIIGPDEFYAYATSKDSFDSRYEYVGWPKYSDIVGKVVTLWGKGYVDFDGKDVVHEE